MKTMKKSLTALCAALLLSSALVAAPRPPATDKCGCGGGPRPVAPAPVQPKPVTPETKKAQQNVRKATQAPRPTK